ncbi:ATP-binding protein [Streptacidiphilus anmyonensis]|uniref:ATP-binding protein n=1 Tax=Streptacidiphilus anmyonensis TaxID=405782 RepID=UPI0005A5F0A2|nr:ATP-binding protein [Streptacidiphilus anmyonensis]
MSGPSIESEAPIQGAPSRQVRRLGLHGVAGAVGRARDFTGGILREWGWLDPVGGGPEARERAEDILLVVSELVANAMAHGAGAREIAITGDGRGLTVAVTDGEAAVPTPLPPSDPARPGGHGLHVVELLSRQWGTTLHVSGKTVWAAFDR